MKIQISCIDKYEAQKLGSLIFLKESTDTFISKILDVFENELVVSLKDKSAHSLVLKDNEQVEAFVDFIQSVIEKKHSIIDVKIIEEKIEIIKE